MILNTKTMISKSVDVNKIQSLGMTKEMKLLKMVLKKPLNVIGISLNM